MLYRPLRPRFLNQLLQNYIIVLLNSLPKFAISGNEKLGQ